MSVRYPRHGPRRGQPSSSSPARHPQRGHSSQPSTTPLRTEVVVVGQLHVPQFDDDQKDATERQYLTQAITKQFACFHTLLLRLWEADDTTNQADLFARYAYVLPEDSTQWSAVLATTAAVEAMGLPAYYNRPWPVHYAGQLPDAFRRDQHRMDRLVRVVQAAANNDVVITRDYIDTTVVQQVEREMAAEAANESSEPTA